MGRGPKRPPLAELTIAPIFYPTTHQIKLVKRVIERKVSKLDKFRQVTLTMGEGIIYDCPKPGQAECYEDNLATTNLPVRDNSANKKIRLIQKSENDQSEESEEV